VLFKGITRDFNRRKCLCGFLHLKPTARGQISTLIFDFFLWRGALLISHKKYIKDGKVLNHLELRSKVLLRPFTELSAWVGFCPTVGCQISTLIFEKKIMERGSL
jgi:hypothetical protein